MLGDLGTLLAVLFAPLHVFIVFSVRFASTSQSEVTIVAKGDGAVRGQTADALGTRQDQRGLRWSERPMSNVQPPLLRTLRFAGGDGVVGS
jgi:hypothetical protein